jgi:hypothetical protein
MAVAHGRDAAPKRETASLPQLEGAALAPAP